MSDSSKKNKQLKQTKLKFGAQTDGNKSCDTSQNSGMIWSSIFSEMTIKLYFLNIFSQCQLKFCLIIVK